MTAVLQCEVTGVSTFQQQAVAWVIVNRALEAGYGGPTIYGVCTKQSQFCIGTPTTAFDSWLPSLLAGTGVTDPVNGAQYYFNPKTKSSNGQCVSSGCSNWSIFGCSIKADLTKPPAGYAYVGCIDNNNGLQQTCLNTGCNAQYFYRDDTANTAFKHLKSKSGMFLDTSCNDYRAIPT